MNKIYVYKIKEKKTDKVVYIGETNQPWWRWQNHISINGKFSIDLHYMDVIDEYIFDNRIASRNYQDELQIQYGFESEKQKRRKQIVHLLSPKNKRGGKARTDKAFASQCVELECPHCKSKGIGRIMYRWHFDKCKVI